MIKTILIFLLAAVCSQAYKNYRRYSPSKDTELKKYSYMTLSLSSAPEYCSNNYCKKGWQKVLPRTDGLIIHGLWPASINLDFLGRMKKNGHDPLCYYKYPYSDKHFSAEELKKLNKYWPSIGRLKYLREHEWNKHGTCYMKLKLKENPSANKVDIFREYFLKSA